MIQVVNRAVDIIEYVAIDNARPKLLGEMAKNLSLNAGTCANIVKTLLTRGYLQKANGKGYLLGKQLYRIVENAGNYKTLIEAADSEMWATTEFLKENTLLAVLKGGKRIAIHKINAEQLVQAHTSDEKNAYDTSSGRLLIAMLNDLEIEDYIKEYGLPAGGIWLNASKRKGFYGEIQAIRDNGYVLIEDSDQITGLAVPVVYNMREIAAFSVYMPSFRCNEKMKKLMIKTLLHSSKKLEMVLRNANLKAE